MTSTGGDPIAFLFSLERLGMKFGLESIAALAEALGQPQRAYQSILIAGTNGKGSVTVMVETALRAAGLRTGRYTSPHLTRLEERFVIDGAEVSSGDLRQAASLVQATVERMVCEGALEGLPTFFECTTATAFELFRAAHVDLAVLEVGLGGRLDATNIVVPIATAITSIDFDHEAQLGTTLASIAREKAGIVKPGVPLVCGPVPPEAERVIAEVCVERGSPCMRATGDAVDSLGPVRLALRGRHQRDNAAVAVTLLRSLVQHGIDISDEAIRAGLEGARWPGRLELFHDGSTEILVDAAHNPAGARALAAWLADAGWSDVTLVVGAMRDKDVKGMLEPLTGFCARLVCTTPATPRALPAAELAQAARELAPHTLVDVVPDPAEALAGAKAAARRVVVAGSIFLIGPLRDILR